MWPLRHLGAREVRNFIHSFVTFLWTAFRIGCTLSNVHLLQKCNCKFSRNLASGCICTGNLKGHRSLALKSIHTRNPSIYSFWRKEMNFWCHSNEYTTCHSITNMSMTMMVINVAIPTNLHHKPTLEHPLFTAYGMYNCNIQKAKNLLDMMWMSLATFHQNCV